MPTLAQRRGGRTDPNHSQPRRWKFVGIQPPGSGALPSKKTKYQLYRRLGCPVSTGRYFLQNI